MDPEGLVLVTGAHGWIGSQLLSALSAHPIPAHVVGLGRQQCDCADPAALRSVIADLRPARVVHLAASLARHADPDSDRRHWRDTFGAGRNLVLEAARGHVGHLVIAGSLDELGDRGGILGPSERPQPRTTYGLCKSLVRDVARFECRNSPVQVDWFRPTTVYGPGQRGDSLVASAFAAACAGAEARFTDGTQERDFLFVDDLIAWLRGAITRPVIEPHRFRVHHLGTGVPTPVRHVLARIAHEFPAARFHLGALPRRPHEPSVQTVSRYHSDDPALSSWRPTTDLAEGIARTAEWWRSLAPPQCETAARPAHRPDDGAAAYSVS